MIAHCQRDFEAWVSDIERPLESGTTEVDAFIERYLEEMAMLLQSAFRSTHPIPL